jgi:ribosome biogenesis GTPase A
VGRNAYDEEEVALELLAYLKHHYAPLLDARYKLGLQADAIAALHDDELLERIARKRGAVMGGGRLNLQKAAEIVLTDLRSAALGRVTLETPQEFEGWLAAAAVQEKERAERKAEQQRRNERRARNAPPQ